MIAVIGSPDRFRVWRQKKRLDAVNITRIDQLRSAQIDEIVYLPGWWLSVDPEINPDEVAARMVGRVS